MSLYYDLLPRDEAAPVNQVYPYLFLKKKIHITIRKYTVFNYYIYQRDLKSFISNVYIFYVSPSWAICGSH